MSDSDAKSYNTIPEQIRQELALAENFYENEEYDEAIVSYKKIIDLNLENNTPNYNIGFYSRLGDLYKLQERTNDAITAYTKAIELSQDFPSNDIKQGIYINRIKCLFAFPSLENLKKIVNDCHSLININQNNGYTEKNVAVYVDLGKAYFKLNAIDSAINSYKQALSLANGKQAIGAYVELGQLYELQNNYTLAIEHYIKAIYCFSKLEQTIAPRIRLANLYRKQGVFNEAAAIYNEIISSSISEKRKLGAYNNLGKLYEDFGQVQGAISCYEKAVKIAPEDKVAYINLVLLLDRLGETEKADSYFTILTQYDDKLIEHLRDTKKALTVSELEKFSYIGIMAFNMAHNINNAVFNISLSTQYGLKKAKENKLNCQEAQKLFGEIKPQINSLTNIVEQFQAIAKDYQNQQEHVDVNKTVRQVADSFYNLLQEKNITLILELSDNELYAYANYLVLQEVLSHLITNAQEELLQKKEAIIWLKTQKTPYYNLIQVVDNGAGIAISAQRDLFLPTQSTKQRGMGLGLYISKTAIERLNGKLTYQDKPDGGACFTIYLLPTTGENT